MAQNYEINIKRFNGQDFDTLLPTPATHASTHQANGSDPITMQTGNYGDATVTNPKIAPGAVGTSNLQNNATTFAKINKNAKSLSFTNIIVSDQAWEEGGNDPKYPYRAAISLPNNGITGDYFADIVFDDTEGLAEYADSFVDGFYIFAEDYPENLVVIRTADLTPTLPTAFTNDVFASIIVTYPVGKNVSCTDNTTTLNAKTTSGKWTFGVPNAGAWTVSDGETSQTVNITTQGQSVSVNMWDGYLYKAGNEYTAITGGWEIVNSDGGNGSLETTYILLSATNSGNRNCSAYTKNKINTVGRSKLVAEVEITALDTDYSTYTFWLGLSETNSDPAETNFIAHTAINELGKKTVELDLAGTQGEYYVKLYTGAGGVAKASIVSIS